jgi:hypothetical protein
VARREEEPLRALLRAALRSASGDRAIALRLAIDRIGDDPALVGALSSSLETGAWRRLVREELVRGR